MRSGNIVKLISLLLLVLRGGGIVLGAEAIEVTLVEFNQVRVPRAKGDWFEMRVVLKCLGVSAEKDGFVRQVGVGVNLGFEADFGRRKGFEFYGSRVVVATLGEGEEASVYFYLPPAIVERDRIGDEPFSWQVDLDIGGKVQPNEEGSYSKRLRDRRVAESFRERMKTDGLKNEGILLPIYETPFYALGGRRLTESPAYVRKSRMRGEVK